MKKPLYFLFIVLYAVAGMFMVIELVRYFEHTISSFVELIVYAGWIAVCFSAYRWIPGVYLSTMSVRKTILEEEQWLHPLMHELSLRTGIHAELLILEKPEIDAFVTGRCKVIVSRGLLVNLSEQEIKAVLAHEYGHLKNRETIASSAFSMASKPFMIIYQLVRQIFGAFKKWFWKKGGIPVKLLGVVLIGTFFYLSQEVFFLLLILFIFMKGFPYFNLLIRAIWCYFSRGHEL